MFTTASPRLYWLRRREGQANMVEIITESGRQPLKFFPFSLRSEGDSFDWGTRGPGTKILAMALLWDVFANRQLVAQFYRKFSDDILEDSRSGAANVITLDMICEWFAEENQGRLSGSTSGSNCGGCGQ